MSFLMWFLLVNMVVNMVTIPFLKYSTSQGINRLYLLLKGDIYLKTMSQILHGHVLLKVQGCNISEYTYMCLYTSKM